MTIRLIYVTPPLAAVQGRVRQTAVAVLTCCGFVGATASASQLAGYWQVTCEASGNGDALRAATALAEMLKPDIVSLDLGAS